MSEDKIKALGLSEEDLIEIKEVVHKDLVELEALNEAVAQLELEYKKLKR